MKTTPPPERIKEALIRKAKEMYATIYPCANKLSLDDCFSRSKNTLYFWFNTSDRSTHILKARIQ